MVGISGVDGLASGLPTGDLIDAMIASDRAATAKLEQRKTIFEARLDLIRGFNSRLLGAQIDLAALKQTATFSARTASSSASAVGATATSAATPGTYNLQNVVMATAHQLATAGQGSDTATLGTGTVTVQLGSGSQQTLDLSAGASLQDLALAISNAGVGVSAYVANDGTGTTPYRLVMQADQTGEDNVISVSGTGAFATLLDGANLTTLQSAGSASFNLGAGAGILVKSASNTVTGVIPGVSLQISQDVASATITVGTDTQVARDAITTFVESLNSSIDYLNEHSAFDADTGEAGLLLSETDLRRGLDGVIRQLFATSSNGGSIKTVTGLGLGIDRDSGRITIDTSVLDTALAADPAGVQALFANSGSSSVAGISLGSLSKATDVSSVFAIDITSPATRATVGATGDLAASTVIDASNSQLGLTINGIDYNIGLVAGTYSRSELVDHLQTVFDQTLPKQHRLQVSLSGDALALSSKAYGSAQTIAVDATSTANSVLLLDTAAAAGSDVAGTIDGQIASGIGQILRGVAGSSSEGLQLVVTVEAPVLASFTARKGLGQQLGERFEGQTDAETGAVIQKQDAFQAIVDDMAAQIAKVDLRLEARRQRFQAMFTNLETILSQFQSQEGFLRNQLDAFSNMAASKAGKG